MSGPNSAHAAAPALGSRSPRAWLPRSSLLRYGAAIVLVGIASALKLLGHRVIGTDAPFVLYLGAITLAAFYGGLGPGLLATVLSALLAAFFFLKPSFSFTLDWEGAVRALLFVAEGCLISALAGAWRRTLTREELLRGMERAARHEAERARGDTLAILESISDPFAVLDREWRYVYLNEAAARAAFGARDDLIGRRLVEIAPDAEESPFLQAYRTAMDERTAVQVEAYSTALEGWYEAHAYPSPTGIAVYLRDVTARRDLEEAARTSERRFRALIERSADGIMLLTHAGGLLYASPAAEHILGYDAGEMHRLDFLDTLRPNLGRLFITAWLDLPPGESRVVQGPVRRGDGAWRWLEATGTNLFDEATVRALAVNVRDITERKEAEEERDRLLTLAQQARRAAEDARRATEFLAQASSTLAESLDYAATLERVARLVVPLLADICFIDLGQPDGEFHRVAVASIPAYAEAAHGLLRYPPTPRIPATMPRALTTGESQLLTDVPDDLIERATQNAEHYDLTRAVAPRSMLVVPLRTRDRTLGLISLGVSMPRPPYTQSDLTVVEEVARRAAVAVDNARLYQEAQDALGSAHEAVAARDRFLSVASHELRTPITALRGHLQLGLRRMSRRAPQQQVQDSFEMALHQVNRINRLINDMLDVSRLGGGQFALDTEPLEVVPFVQRLVDSERAVAPDYPITLALPEDRSARLQADAARLEQVLSNLLQNARKYSPSGTTIAVSVDATPDEVRLAVRDAGIGIPPEDQERIFAAFQRATNVDAGTPGLGLGLYITRELVRAHGGSLALASTEGEGSTFTVTLPRLPDVESDYAVSPPPASPDRP